MTDHQFEVILDGGGPWGFRLQGGKDFGIPLNVSRVTPGSKAAYKQIVAGDIICRINGVDTEGLSHMEAQNHIKNAGSRLQLIVRKGKGISIADQNAIALGAAGSPKVMTQTDVIHSANVDHQFNPKPKPFAFSPSSTPAAQSTSPAKVAAPTSSVHAPKFDPGAYARKKKEELEQRKKAESNVAGDSDILKMINATSISKSPSPPFNSVGEDLPPPPPELIDDNEVPTRMSFGSSGPGVQSKTFKMLQDSIGNDQAHESVFSRPSDDRNKAVPMPRKVSPAPPQQTTVNPIPKPPMPSGPSFKATSPKAPTFNANSSPNAFKPTFNANSSPNAFKPSGAPPSFKPSSSPQPASSPQVTTAKVSSQKAALPIDPSRTPICHGCNQEIRGPFVSALGRTWHPEHFVCNSCKVSLQNQGFVEEQDKLFCETCYNSFFAPKCAACDKPIIGARLQLLNDGQFHCYCKLKAQTSENSFMAGEQKMSDLGLKASLSRLGIRTRGRGSTGSSLTRLNSLKPARDLTLGSTPKRTFVPNLPARRVLKEEPENEKKEAGPSKDRSEKLSRRDQTRPRGRGRGRGDLITSHSIFSQGPFAVSSSVGTAVSASSQSSNRKSGSRETRSHASIITEGAGELEYDEESKKVLERLDDSGKIDITTDELQHGGLVPITIPLADPKLFGQRLEDAAQEKASFEAASMHNKVKHEPNDDIDMAYSDDISSPRVAAKTKRQLHCHELFSSSNAEERLLFMQFPDVLPIKPLSHEDNMPNDNEDSPKSSSISKSEEERQNFSFNNVSEGCIGKLVIHKSGRVRMLLGNTSLHVEMGTPCGFLQDLVAIHLEEDRKEMICLGHIDHRIICVPDYEELIGSAGS